MADPPGDLPADPGPITSARRVLVVEDDPTLGDVVSRFLQKEGFDVEVIRDGVVGLERALEWLPDLVVLDLMLPSMNGSRRVPEVARHRADPRRSC